MLLTRLDSEMMPAHFQTAGTLEDTKMKNATEWIAMLTLVCAGVAPGCALDADGDAENVAQVGDQIIQGADEAVHSNPNVVAVYHGWPRPCSGTVIDNRRNWVITAAHCVTEGTNIESAPLPPSSIRLSRQIAPGLTPPADAVTPTRVVTHGVLDLALLEVPGIGGPGGHALWLAPSSTLLGKTLNCFGYGRFVHNQSPYVEDGTSGAGRLRRADLPVISFNSTQYEFGSNSVGQILGHGDSGGPSFYWRDFGVGDWERFITGVHRNSDSVSSSRDDTIAAGAAWIFQTIGSMLIRRVQVYQPSRASNH